MVFGSMVDKALVAMKLRQPSKNLFEF